MNKVSFLGRIIKGFDSHYFKKVSFLTWIYSAYLTIRFVDKWNIFPAIQLNQRFKFKIYKSRNAKIIIGNRLCCDVWINGKGSTAITIAGSATLEIQNDFIMGDGMKIYVANGGKLLLKGKKNESGSGITANSVVMVYNYVEIGHDCIIAWDTFISDCDWHTIEGKKSWDNTIIGDHVWIGVGAKILKGSIIGNNSIIGTNSVIVKGNYPESSFISGIPGKVVQSNISRWNRDMQD